MTTELGRMVSRAFEPNTPDIPEASFGKIRGSKPWIVGMMAPPSCTDDEASLVITGNARTRGANPSMAGRTCPFPKFDDLGSASVSMISSMTTEEGETEVTLQRCLSKY